MKEVREFENTIAKYFGSKYAVATDCCTHAVELCLRYLNYTNVTVPKRTYLSIPMTCEKLKLNWKFRDENWENYYFIGNHIIDAAVYWKENGYIQNTLMCLSFQHKKHLNLGKGGMILVDNDYEYVELKKMSYDGRSPDVPWQEQKITSMGYHYYMTPETALMGSLKFNSVKNLPAKKWSYKDYIDLSELPVFKKNERLHYK